ncbi:Bardet-Biedl syndrome 7 protein homolog isoform X2 [Anabrus simplex]|uniref:Bardet-Biedl syndrome 7 protein homolog isoform X2 n=1 Tax=Anabrus simplex TaxID=316456 RepID=UPI0035A2A4FC
MDLELSRIDYTLVGLTSPKTMKLLPNQGPKMMQRVAVADKDGVLQVFSLKKGEIQLGFRTSPGPPVSCLELGGAFGTVKDKIFISAENEVRAYTKKGKLFLGFDTNLTEPIRSMHVSGSNLLVCGNHVYNQYHDCKDANSYLCGDQINDVMALVAEKTNRLTPVLACEDRMLRVLDRSQVLHNVQLDAVPTVLHLNGNDGGEGGDELMYGTADGRIGVVQVNRNEVNHRWILNDGKRRSGILCMDCYDITGDGVLDILVGHQDGLVEVYSFSEEEQDGSIVVERFSHACSESITSVQGGVVGNAGFDEIVATTYTGWLFGLTTEVMDKQVGVDTRTGNLSISQDARMKIMRLRSEIDEIEQRVNRERDRYQSATLDKSEGMSAIPFIAINDQITLCKEDASYLLTLEVQTAIDNVLLQSDVPVDLLDLERNSAVSGNFLLATYRCQLNTTRLEVKIRTIEGQHGTLQAYVTPLVQPKCCQVRQYSIKPLSLHMRCHTFDPERPYNVLTLKGSFSLAEIHAWIVLCLPEVPEKPPTGDRGSFVFVSTFLDTMLQCTYSKGEAEFKSDNISTISILKDILTKEATKKKIKLDISCVVNDESVFHTLRLLHPKLEAQLQLANKVAILDALRELETHDADATRCLLPEYKDMLQNEKKIQAEFKKQPAHLDRLYGMITDLFIDRHKFKGINVKGKVPQLLEVLDKYDLDNLMNFFKQQSD